MYVANYSFYLQQTVSNKLRQDDGRLGKMQRVMSTAWRKMLKEEKGKWGEAAKEYKPVLQSGLCEKSFKKEKYLKYHIKNCGDYSCDVCQKEFSNKENLRRHKAVHVDKEYECTSCDKKYVNMQALRRHQASHTTVFRCVACDKSFSYNINLSRHVKKFHA